MRSCAASRRNGPGERPARTDLQPACRNGRVGKSAAAIIHTMRDSPPPRCCGDVARSRTRRPPLGPYHSLGHHYLTPRIRITDGRDRLCLTPTVGRGITEAAPCRESPERKCRTEGFSGTRKIRLARSGYFTSRRVSLGKQERGGNYGSIIAGTTRGRPCLRRDQQALVGACRPMFGK